MAQEPRVLGGTDFGVTRPWVGLLPHLTQGCSLRQVPTPFRHLLPGPRLLHSLFLPVACHLPGLKKAVWGHYIFSCLGERMFALKLAVKPFGSIHIFKAPSVGTHGKCYLPSLMISGEPQNSVHPHFSLHLLLFSLPLPSLLSSSYEEFHSFPISGEMMKDQKE